jgi:hypothetical protein
MFKFDVSRDVFCQKTADETPSSYELTEGKVSMN